MGAGRKDGGQRRVEAMKTNHELYDFVRPRYATTGEWRVIKIDSVKNSVVAKKTPSRLDEIGEQVQASPDFFISLEEEEGAE